MNFRNDLCEIAKQLLAHYGIDSSSATMDRDFIEMYMNIRLRLIRLEKYQVLRSKALTARNLPQKVSEGINSVQEKLEQGIDVTPHMSKSILDGTFTDLLFSDWGIYHLHLGLSMEGNFIERTKEVLFLSIQENRAYFIDVREHGPDGEEYVFSQFDLLQILADEFPEVIEPFELKNATDLSINVTDPKDTHDLRQAGVSMFRKINDKVYAPMGDGITSASTSARVVEETDRLLIWADNQEKHINEKREKLDTIFSQAANYEADRADFCLCVDDNGFLLVDKHSRVSMRLLYP